jgi:hypothetical protein
MKPKQGIQNKTYDSVVFLGDMNSYEQDMSCHSKAHICTAQLHVDTDDIALPIINCYKLEKPGSKEHHIIHYDC